MIELSVSLLSTPGNEDNFCFIPVYIAYVGTFKQTNENNTVHMPITFLFFIYIVFS